MARINIYEELPVDPRFTALCVLIPRHLAYGALVGVWEVGQVYWKKDRSNIPEGIGKLLPNINELVAVGLVRKTDTGFYCAGAKDRWAFLVSKAEAGKKSAQARIEKFGSAVPHGASNAPQGELSQREISEQNPNNSEQTPNNSEQRRTDSEHAEPSSSSSSSSSSSNSGGGERASAREGLPSPGAAPPWGKFEVAKELKGDPELEAALEQIPEFVQQAWITTYELAWLKRSLIQAVGHGVKKSGVQRASQIENWYSKLNSWIKNERKPQFRPKPNTPRARAAPAEIEVPTTTAAEVLSNGAVSKLRIGSQVLSLLERQAGAG